MGSERSEAGASEGARRATGDAPAGGERGRFSSKRKLDAVLRLLRGESIETLSRELKVTAATLSEWRDTVLSASRASLKSRGDDDDGRADQIRELQAKIGEITMENEALRTRARAAEAKHPLAQRRWRP